MMVAGKVLDLSVVVLPVENSLLEIIEIGDFNLICALPAGHRLHDAQDIQSRDLESERLITNSNGSQIDLMTDEMFRDAGVVVQKKFIVHNQEIACNLVSRGIGIALFSTPLPCHIRHYPGIVFKHLTPDVRTKLGNILCNTKQQSAMVREFCEHIMAQSEMFER